MGDSITVVLISALFILITLYIVSTAFINVSNFKVLAKKHSRIPKNNDILSSSNKENVQTGASPSNITIGGENSFVATNTTQGSSISHSIGNLKSAEKLANQEKHLAQTKLRQVLAETIPHQYIVVLKNGITENPQSIAQQAISKGGIVQFVYNNAIKGFAIKIANKLVLNSILSNPSVEFVEPDIKVQAFSQVASTGYSRVGGSSSILNGSHPQASVNAGIAIIDTGIDFTHPELNIYKQISFVPGTSTANDDNGHGTAVAGIVAAEGRVGAVGIAPGARLWAVKVLDRSGTGSMSSIIEGIDYVTQNAGQIDAANLSFGCKCNSSALDTAINNSVAAGVTFVVAAGNAGEDTSLWSPASNPNVISVAAMADSDGKCGALGPPTKYGPDDSLASFSNFGSKVTIAAPGVDIHTTYIGSAYATLSGTSVAAPFVTGAAALYHSLHPTASPAQVRSALVSLASTATTVCNGDGHGYFSNPHGSEPLLYIGSFTHG
ncbi:MAG TPA: S8 family serine peptidase [Candidatus Nitrosopolaris sp.]|nr:S8 family serine peptidase [Candidatus Nitrosopolaris sp.]